MSSERGVRNVILPIWESTEAGLGLFHAVGMANTAFDVIYRANEGVVVGNDGVACVNDLV